jgi:hypothetical protein
MLADGRAMAVLVVNLPPLGGGEGEGLSVSYSAKEASNPDEDEQRPETHNPVKMRPAAAPVYRVTSLPLDAYTEAAKNRMHMQDMWKIQQQRHRDTQKRLSQKGAGWWWGWGCCWIGWLGFV